MKHSASSLFLMEMILSLLFFSLSAIVCVQLFVSAHRLSIRTGNLNQAHLHAQNLAEGFLGSGGELSLVQDLLADFNPTLSCAREKSASSSGSQALLLFFDKSWNSTEEDTASFLASLTLNSDEKGLKKASVTVTCLEDGSILYSVPLSLYISSAEVSHE